MASTTVCENFSFTKLSTNKQNASTNKNTHTNNSSPASYLCLGQELCGCFYAAKLLMCSLGFSFALLPHCSNYYQNLVKGSLEALPNRYQQGPMDL